MRVNWCLAAVVATARSAAGRTADAYKFKARQRDG